MRTVPRPARIRVLPRRSLLAAAAALALAACTLEPHYDRPAAPVADAWPSAPAAQGDTHAAELGWRDFFQDPALNRLIALALTENRDLRVSTGNVAAAEAQYQIQRAALFPSVNAALAQSASRTPRDLVPPGYPQQSRVSSFTVGITSYELDLFGRIRSLDDAALETYFGLDETRQAAQITLIASVADAYFQLLADQQLLDVTKRTAATQEESFQLTQRTLQYGTGTELSVRQAETALESARANEAAYTRAVALDRDALTLLVGAPLPADLSWPHSLDNEKLVAPLPAGLPAEVLTRRPDVLAAEHQLMAANANIGAARAAFFPRITLTGAIGTESPALSGLFSAGSRSWNFLPQVTLPLFSGGTQVANLDLATVEKRIQVATYEKTVQTAFREVADALASIDTLDAQMAAQTRLVAASQKSYDLANLRFKTGVDSYLTALDAERTLYAAQQGLVAVQLARLQNLVGAYRALGGGLSEHGPSQTASAPASAGAS